MGRALVRSIPLQEGHAVWMRGRITRSALNEMRSAVAVQVAKAQSIDEEEMTCAG